MKAKSKFIPVLMYIALISFSFKVNGQALSWAKGFNGVNSETSRAVAVDASGNVYTTGYFNGTTDFDPDTGTFNLSSVAGYDIFVCKLDNTGGFVWAKQIGGTSDEFAQAIDIDTNGSVYITGSFTGTVDFDPGPNVHNINASGSDDAFVLKLSSTGNFVWMQHFGGLTSDRGLSVHLDLTGNVYAGGYFTGSSDFDPGTGTTILNSSFADGFVVKLTNAGNFVWAKQITATAGNLGSKVFSVFADNGGNVYTTGEFQGNTDFDPGSGTFFLSTVNDYDIFVSKLDASGNFVWARQMGGTTDDDIGNSIAVDASGNIYTTGTFKNIADFDPGAGLYQFTSFGAENIFVSKLNSSGNFLWAQQIGGALSSFATHLSLDVSGNVYTTGYFTGAADFDPGSANHSLSSPVPGNDIFVCRLDATGNFNWAVNVGDSLDDYGFGLDVDVPGNVYFTGSFQGDPDFDAGLPGYVLHASGMEDAFAGKLAQGCLATNNSFSVSACFSYLSPSTLYTWKIPGVYNDTIPNAAGCDSILTINLTILNPNSATISASGCDSYVSPSGNYTWTASGTYTDTVTNAVGCDSVMTINLTINTSTSKTIFRTACDFYISPSTAFTWTTSGTYVDIIPNANGCDSIITVHLTIHNSNTSSISPMACGFYISPSGNYTWTSSGTYTDTITNVNGCDSIITVTLTLNNSYGVISPTVCNSYLSPSTHYTWIASGTYTDTLTNSVGCDSIITIHLTIHLSTVSVIAPVACKFYTSPGGTYTWIDSGVYSDTIPNAAGCDSIILIDLTIISNDTSVTQVGSTLTSNGIADHYQWVDCNNGFTPVAGDTNQSFTPLVTGNYAVILTSLPCSDTSACYFVIGAGVPEYALRNNITVYPNPVNDKLNITIDNSELSEIILYDISCRTILNEIFIKTITINTGELAKGIYMYQVRNKSGVIKNGKVVKN